MAARTTLSDVAREAGVSLATASRAINGSANRSVRPELAARVLAAAEKLSYSPDANAQAMARGHTTTLGLIVHDIADPYFSAIAAGVVRSATEAGLQVTLTTTQNDAGREAELVDLMRRQRARAVVVAGGREIGEHGALLGDAVTAFRQEGGGVAVIGQPIDGISAVAVNNTQGSADLAAALLDLGYRDMAVIGGPTDRLTARDRRTGFLEALAAQGVEIAAEDVLTCAFTWEGGYQAMTTLLERDHLPELVFATNDVMALGALAAAREAGKSVPRDVALAGFGDTAPLRDVTPGLTTVRIPMEYLGTKATDLALAAPDTREVVTVPCEVIVRESTPARSSS